MIGVFRQQTFASKRPPLPGSGGFCIGLGNLLCHLTILDCESLHSRHEGQDRPVVVQWVRYGPGVDSDAPDVIYVILTCC